jgi:hypothetical protein
MDRFVQFLGRAAAGLAAPVGIPIVLWLVASWVFAEPPTATPHGVAGVEDARATDAQARTAAAAKPRAGEPAPPGPAPAHAAAQPSPAPVVPAPAHAAAQPSPAPVVPAPAVTTATEARARVVPATRPQVREPTRAVVAPAAPVQTQSQTAPAARSTVEKSAPTDRAAAPDSVPAPVAAALPPVAAAPPAPPAPPVATFAPESSASGVDLGQQLLREARAAAWEGRDAEAVSRYQAYLAQSPRSYEGYGELGNVFYRMRQWPQAGWAYTTACLLLLAEGHFESAASMVSVLSQIDPAGAALVNQQLWAARGR